MKIRRLQPQDRESIRDLLAGTRAFQPHELDVAMELVDTALTQPEQQDYHPYVLQENGTIVAYACFGKNPMARFTYDLYWLATRAGQMRKGYGRKMFVFVEQQIRRRGGRLLVIETSSKARVDGPHHFYANIGCEFAARLPDFYDGGDDKLIYFRRLQ